MHGTSWCPGEEVLWWYTSPKVPQGTSSPGYHEVPYTLEYRRVPRPKAPGGNGAQTLRVPLGSTTWGTTRAQNSRSVRRASTRDKEGAVQCTSPRGRTGRRTERQSMEQGAVMCASARRGAPEHGPELRTGARRGAELLRAMSVSQSSVSQSVSLPVRESISLSVRQSLSLSVSQSLSRPVSQSVTQSATQSVTLSVTQTVSQSASLYPQSNPYYLLYSSITVPGHSNVLNVAIQLQYLRI